MDSVVHGVPVSLVLHVVNFFNYSILTVVPSVSYRDYLYSTCFFTMVMYYWHSQLDLGAGVTIPASDYFKFRRTNANRYINDLLRYFFPVEVLASSSLTGGECFANKDKGPSNKNQLDPCIIRVITRKDAVNPSPMLFFYSLSYSCLTLCSHFYLVIYYSSYSCICVPRRWCDMVNDCISKCGIWMDKGREIVHDRRAW